MIDDAQFIDDSYFKVFVEKTQYDEEIDYCQNQMRDEIMDDARVMMNDMVATLVMTAIEDTKVNLTATLEQTIEETTQSVTNMVHKETTKI